MQEEKTPAQRRDELRSSLGISSWDNTFNTWKVSAGSQKAFSTIEALSSGKTPWQMVLCYGGVGCGKTHLCEATAIALYQRGIFCRVLVFAKVIRTLKQSMQKDATTSYDALLDRLCRCGHLIIDDVGAGMMGSEWEFSNLEEIVVSRYRDNLFTLLTTNLDEKQLPERIISRFKDPDRGRLVLNKAGDYRSLKNKGEK